MEEKVHFGNFKIESNRNGGWFVGSFLEEEKDKLRKLDNVEIKFWELPQSKADHKMKYEPKAVEITILLKGRIEGGIENKEKGRYEKIKLKADDYVIIPARVINGFPETVLEYAQGITIKLPSKRDRQKVSGDDYRKLKDTRDKS